MRSKEVRMNLSINGNVCDYQVEWLERIGERHYFRSEQLQREWSLELMRWIEKMYFVEDCEYGLDAIVGIYRENDLIYSVRRFVLNHD